jgi:lambda family phage minor tail protein L
MKENIHKEIFELEPSTMIILYEIVFKNPGVADRYYFHAGENGYKKDILFAIDGSNRKSYYYHPIKAEGFSYTDGELPRPTLTADNTDSFFSLKTRFFKDFVGYQVNRIRTFVKFLHGSNFPNNVNPFGSPTEDSFPVEKYIINKKTAENQNVVQFELVSALEKEAAFIPNRKIVYNACQWQYRNPIGCGYNGPPKTDAKGNPLVITGEGTPLEYSDSATYNKGQYVKITNIDNPNLAPKFFVCLANGTKDVNPQSDKTKWIEDACAKNIQGCRSRFGTTENSDGIPFGGFPGTWQY